MTVRLSLSSKGSGKVRRRSIVGLARANRPFPPEIIDFIVFRDETDRSNWRFPKMLRWITLIAAVVFLTAAATYYTQTGSNSTRGPVMVGVPEGKGPQPKWEISQPLLFEFGVLPQNTKHSHSWEVKNAGEGDLEMWMKSSTCSCTIAKLATKEGEETKKVIVKPKDSTTIDLEWETKPGNTQITVRVRRSARTT